MMATEKQRQEIENLIDNYGKSREQKSFNKHNADINLKRQ
jgi:hypothetical protein